MKKVGELKKIYLLPNLVTSAGLFAGAYSITLSLNKDFVWAAWAIMVAGIFDALDGRLARLTKSESAFGTQYDSLADLISFGVAPAILLYSWTLHSFARLGVVVTFLYIACAALRLARFNVQVDKVEKRSFQGLPVPAASGFLATLIIFYTHLYGPIRVESHLAMILCVALSILMVSTVRYPSFKGIDFRSRSPFYYLVGVIALIVVIALEPRVTLFLLASVYVSYGIIESLVLWQKGVFSRHAEEVAAKRHRKKSGGTKVLQINRESARERQISKDGENSHYE